MPLQPSIYHYHDKALLYGSSLTQNPNERKRRVSNYFSRLLLLVRSQPVAALQLLTNFCYMFGVNVSCSEFIASILRGTALERIISQEAIPRVAFSKNVDLDSWSVVSVTREALPAVVYWAICVFRFVVRGPLVHISLTRA